MSDSDTCGQLVSALSAAAANEASAESALVSISIEMISRSEVCEIKVALMRKTRTLAFFAAEARDSDGQLRASASAVYKLIA